MSWGSHGKADLLWLSPEIDAFTTAVLYLLRPGPNLATCFGFFSVLLSISQSSKFAILVLKGNIRDTTQVVFPGSPIYLFFS